MKLKKLFAGVVAVAMMATMSFPAFAATSGKVHILTNDKVEVDKVYKLVGVGDSPLETFGFNISALTGLNKNGAEKVANVPVPTVSSADFSETHATGAGATKKFLLILVTAITRMSVLTTIRLQKMQLLTQV